MRDICSCERYNVSDLRLKRVSETLLGQVKGMNGCMLIKGLVSGRKANRDCQESSAG